MVMQLLVVPFVLLSVLLLDALGGSRAICGFNAWAQGTCLRLGFLLATFFCSKDFSSFFLFSQFIFFYVDIFFISVFLVGFWFCIFVSKQRV